MFNTDVTCIKMTPDTVFVSVLLNHVCITKELSVVKERKPTKEVFESRCNIWWKLSGSAGYVGHLLLFASSTLRKDTHISMRVDDWAVLRGKIQGAGFHLLYLTAIVDLFDFNLCYYILLKDETESLYGYHHHGTATHFLKNKTGI